MIEPAFDFDYKTYTESKNPEKDFGNHMFKVD